MTQPSKVVQMDGKTKKLLSKIIKQGILEFKPTLDKNGVHYLEIEKNLKDADPAYVEDMLQDLETQGVLESMCIDRVLTCPHCGSPDVHSKYTCRKCGSYNAEYIELIEHMKCGYIGPKDKFVRDSSLVCPGCRAEFDEDSKGITYRGIGSCYQCEKCGYRFDKPEIVHFCQKCGRSSTYQETKYIKVCSYKVTEETINSLGKDLPVLGEIEKILTSKGFEVQLHPQIEGASGVQHSFDILAEKAGTRLVVDVSITGNKNDMISLLGKKVDVNPTKALIIDLSNLDELTQLGKVYDIPVFKITDNRNLRDQFGDLIATLN